MGPALERLALAEVLELRNRAGAPDRTVPGAGIRFRARLSHATVHWLIALWQRCDAPRSGVALACTGSLARRESGPLSDLDLVVLHDTGLDPQRVAQVAEGLWYPIWDSGIALDHAVRSVQQCRRIAADDLHVAGAMLDLSPIAGDADLVRRGVHRLAEDWRAHARKRMPELSRQVTDRHRRYGELAQLLEPELKEAKGGLRDMAVLRAVTSSWLADRPHGEVDGAYTFLLDVRDAVHLVTKRPRTLLTRDDQGEVAERLGLADADELISRIGTASRRISLAVDGTLRRAGQSQRARLTRRGPRRPDLVPLHPGVYSHDGEIVTGPVRGGTEEDARLVPLRAAAASATLQLPLSPLTARKLADLTLPSRPWPQSVRQLFVELLGGPGLLETWNALDLSGVIDHWLPEWAGIRDRPQRSPLHRHTVDRHSLECVLEAHRLTGRVERPDLLLMAALCHDLGKRPGASDHCAAGVPLIRAITVRQGWPEADAAVLRLLVAEHLTLMTLATSRDVTDPATARQLARHVNHDSRILHLLAALTEADARSAGSRAWSAGRAALLRELVTHTDAVIQTCGEAAS